MKPGVSHGVVKAKGKGINSLRALALAAIILFCDIKCKITKTERKNLLHM